VNKGAKKLLTIIHRTIIERALDSSILTISNFERLKYKRRQRFKIPLL
jgi:hypothetical protein